MSMKNIKEVEAFLEKHKDSSIQELFSSSQLQGLADDIASHSSSGEHKPSANQRPWWKHLLNILYFGLTPAALLFLIVFTFSENAKQKKQSQQQLQQLKLLTAHVKSLRIEAEKTRSTGVRWDEAAKGQSGVVYFRRVYCEKSCSSGESIAQAACAPRSKKAKIDRCNCQKGETSEASVRFTCIDL